MEYALTDLGIRYAGSPRGYEDWSDEERAERIAHWMMERGHNLE